jgi:2-methylcitrate dehydratase PrpD
MTADRSVRSARLCAAVSGILFLAVLIAGGVRSANEPRPAPMKTAPPGTEIAVFASDRNALRQQEIADLKEIAAAPESSEAVRAAAQERMMSLRRWMEQEATVEAVLSARGYETPVVTVHSDSVNIIVRAESISQADAEVILELTTRETGASGANVKIIPIN